MQSVAFSGLITVVLVLLVVAGLALGVLFRLARTRRRAADEERDRRAVPRSAGARPVMVSRGIPRAEPTPSIAVEVSATGLLVTGPDDLHVGDEVFVSLELHAGEPPIDGKAEVVRETGAGYKGMRFTRVAPDDLERLQSL